MKQYRPGFVQMRLLQYNKPATVSEAIALINKAKFKRGNIFDCKG